MALKTTLKDPSNGIIEDAYLKKHSFLFDHNGTGRIEMEVYQSEELRNIEGVARMQRLLTIALGDGEITREKKDEETGEITSHELLQIDYKDIKTEYDALWKKIYGIIKTKKILYGGVETDLAEAEDC